MARRILSAQEQAQLLSPWRLAYDIQSPAPDLATPLQTKRGPKVKSQDPINDPMGHMDKRPFNYQKMVDNLVSHYNGATDEDTVLPDGTVRPSERKQGRLWYKAAHDMFHNFAKERGISPERAVAMGAAFSPLTDWGDNVYHAQKFMLGYRPDDPNFNPHDWQTAHVDPKALDAYRKQYGADPTDSDEDLHALADLHADAFKRGPKSQAVNDLSNPDARANWMANIQHHGIDHILADSAAQAEANKKKPNWRPSMAMRPSGINTLGSNLQKAKELHESPEDIAQMFKVLGGPKISHFTDNILDDTPINSEGYYEHPNGDWMQNKDLGGTIDSHHVRAASMPHGGWERKGYASKNPSTDHEYDVFNRGLFEATKRINDAEKDPSKHITPKQLQAIVWLKHKNDKDFFERQKNPVTGKGIMHESELGGNTEGRKDWQYIPKSYKSRAASLDENDFADMPPLWRKMFMGRQPQEWTELLEAYVNHHSPGDEGHGELPHHTSRWYLADVNPHSQNTQRGNTYNTNLNAHACLNDHGAFDNPDTRYLDFGAGHGMTGRPNDESLPPEHRGLGADTFEPNPKPDKFVGVNDRGELAPTWTDSHHIPDGHYHAIQSTNVMNVLEPGDDVGQRGHAYRELDRILAPGGQAVITVRPHGDVMGATTGRVYEGEPNSLVLQKKNPDTGETEEWFQHGYQHNKELADEWQGHLGDGYTVKPARYIVRDENGDPVLNKRGQPVTKPVSNRAIHIIKHPVRTASLSWYRTPRLSWYINAEAAEALDDDEPSGKHSHCIVCGRPLTDPESQARGYGPTCAGDYNHMFIEAVDEGLQKDLMTQAMRQMRNKQKAEDLFQETMVKAFRFYPSFKVPSGKEPRAALKNWLFRTMTNTLINDDRREKRGPKMTPVDELTDRTLADEEGYATDTRPRSAEDEYLKRITDSRLRDAFDAIPEQFREPVYLADIEGVPYKEIAEMMGIPPGTVMSRIKRGRDKLREILAPQATGRGFNVARRLSWYRSPWYRYADLGLVTPSLAPISGGSGIGFGTSAGDAKPGEHENSWGLKPYSQMGGPTGTGGGGGGGGASSSGGGGAPANYSPGAGVEQWRDEVLLGLQRNGLPSTLADQVLHQMETESSGNPRAINNWDSNAQKGTPSKGLLQTIDPTFKQYKLPGDADDPYDPQANVDAAINYSKSRYGPTLMNNGQGMGSGTGY